MVFIYKCKYNSFISSLRASTSTSRAYWRSHIYSFPTRTMCLEIGVSGGQSITHATSFRDRRVRRAQPGDVQPPLICRFPAKPPTGGAVNYPTCLSPSPPSTSTRWTHPRVEWECSHLVDERIRQIIVTCLRGRPESTKTGGSTALSESPETADERTTF